MRLQTPADVAGVVVELVCPQCTAAFRAHPGSVVACPVCSYRGGRVPGLSRQREYQAYQGAWTADDGNKLPGTTPEEVEVETNRAAITSLVLGLSIVVPPAGLFAIMFGIIGLTQIKDSKERDDMPEQKGRGLAVAGIATGALFQLVWFIFIIMALAGLTNVVDGVLGR